MSAADPVQAFKDRVTGMAQGALVLHQLQIGEELGIWAALSAAKGDGLSSAQLAAAVKMNPRYAQEWTLCMASNGILDHIPSLKGRFRGTSAEDRFRLKPELIPAFGDESTLALGGITIAGIMAHEKLLAAYKTGAGVNWGEHHPLLTSCTKRFFRPLYENALVPNLPESIRASLEAGGTLVDIGCGEGVSAHVLGAAFPKASIKGVDFFGPAIEKAINVAKEKNLSNCSFEVAGAESGGGTDASADVVTFYDCFHDMAVATAAAKNAFRLLKPGGQVMLIELLSSEEDTVAAQLEFPSCAVYSCFSCHFCLPCGMCNGGDGLGTTVPTSIHRKLFVGQAGFKALDSIATPLNEMGFRILIAQKDLASM